MRSQGSEKLSDLFEVTCYPGDVNNLLNDTELANGSKHPPHPDNVLTRAWPLLCYPSRIFQTKQVSKHELVLSQSPLATTLLFSLRIRMTEHFVDLGILMAVLLVCKNKEKATHKKTQ